MINLEFETKLSAEEATKRVKSYFGDGGLGLKTAEDSADCLNFEGGGGFVNVVVCSSGGGKTTVRLASREWEQQVKEFAAKLS